MRALLAAVSLWLAAALCPAAAAERPRVHIQTNLGSFVIELYPDYAPKTVASFLQYMPSREILLEKARVLAPDGK